MKSGSRNQRKGRERNCGLFWGWVVQYPRPPNWILIAAFLWEAVTGKEKIEVALAPSLGPVGFSPRVTLVERLSGLVTFFPLGLNMFCSTCSAFLSVCVTLCTLCACIFHSQINPGHSYFWSFYIKSLEILKLMYTFVHLFLFYYLSYVSIWLFCPHHLLFYSICLFFSLSVSCTVFLFSLPLLENAEKRRRDYGYAAGHQNSYSVLCSAASKLVCLSVLLPCPRTQTAMMSSAGPLLDVNLSIWCFFPVLHSLFWRLPASYDWWFLSDGILNFILCYNIKNKLTGHVNNHFNVAL